MTVPFGTDLTALIATFTTTGVSLKVGGVTQISGTTANNFSNPLTYTVIAADGSTQDYIVTTIIKIITPPSPQIGIAKTVSTPMRQMDGFDSNIITYKITVENYGNVSLKNIQVTDDLTKSFPFPTQFSLQGVPTTSKGILQANSGYDGRVNNKLLKINSTMLVGENDTIQFTVKVTPFNFIMGPYYNTATASAIDPDGKLTEDISTQGTNPDPDKNGIPDEGLATVVMLEKVTVRVPEGFSPNGDGINDMLMIENLDNERISLQIFNPLGVLIYKNDDYQNEWNGISNQGKEIPDGTYYYVLSKRGDKEKYHSFLTVNR